jgi:hypothetical protein
VPPILQNDWTREKQQANAMDTAVPLIFLNILIIVWAIAFG